MLNSLLSIPKCILKQFSVFDKFTHHQFDPHSLVFTKESLAGLKLVFHRIMTALENELEIISLQVYFN